MTEHPTAAWTAQQIIEAFPEEIAPRFLLRDRDQIYGEEFRRRVAGMRMPLYRERNIRRIWESCEIAEVGGLHHRYERRAA